MNLDLLPSLYVDPNYTCEICVETKLAKTPFHSIERKTKPLELIHNGICDMKFVHARGGKKVICYFYG